MYEKTKRIFYKIIGKKSEGCLQIMVILHAFPSVSIIMCFSLTSKRY